MRAREADSGLRGSEEAGGRAMVWAFAADFGGEDFLLAPDHEVLEGVFEFVVAEHALVDGFDVVDEGDVEVGVEGGELVEVEGGEEAVFPAESGVGVDQDVVVLGRFGDDVAHDGAAELVECEREG